MTAIYRPILDKLNLTYTQFIVMMALWEKDHVSISELARRTGLSKPTLTPLLKRLQEKELITLERVANNERQKDVVLTGTGKSLASKSNKATEEAFCATGLSENEAGKLISLCQLLVERAER